MVKNREKHQFFLYIPLREKQKKSFLKKLILASFTRNNFLYKVIKMDKKNSYFITFNPHPNDVKKFNDFLFFLIPAIIKYSDYQLVVEKNKTPDAHFHAIVCDDSIRDAEKLKISLYKDLKKQYSIFNHTETGKSKMSRSKFEAPAWKIIKLKREDVKNRIGYLFKECYNETRQSNMDLEYQLECLKEYIIQEQINIKQDKYAGLEEWKLLSVGNAHMHIQHFMKENIPDDVVTEHSDLDVRTMMQKSNYSFAKLGKKAEEDIWHEIWLRVNKNYFKEKYPTTKENNYQPYWIERDQLIEEISQCNASIDSKNEKIEKLQYELRQLKKVT